MGRQKQSNTNLPTGITKFKGKYRVRVTVYSKQYEIGLFESLTVAKAVLETTLIQKATGSFVPPSQRRKQAKEQRELEVRESVTLEAWSQDWLARLHKRGRTESTIVSYRSIMNHHVLPALGHLPVKDITREHINDLADQLQARKSVRNPNASQGTNGVFPNTIRVLRSCFSDAVDLGIGGIKESPVRVEIEKKKVLPAQAKGETASPSEVWALYDAMPENLRVAVLLAGFVGLRLGEVLGLQRNDFGNLEIANEAFVNVQRQVNTKAVGAAITKPKAGSARVNSLPAAVVPHVVEHLTRFAAEGPEGALFPSNRSENKRVSQTSFDKHWREARLAIDRPGFRFHALRATALTLFAHTGASNVDLMHRGGHKSLKVAEGYQHSVLNREHKLTAKLNEQIQR